MRREPACCCQWTISCTYINRRAGGSFPLKAVAYALAFGLWAQTASRISIVFCCASDGIFE